MSLAQYNLKTKTDYLQRKMFLDPAGPVTIQRFEEVQGNQKRGLSNLLGTADTGNELGNLEQVLWFVSGAGRHVSMERSDLRTL